MEKFNTSIPGYSKKEVNKFVNDVIREYEEVLNKLKDCDQKRLALSSELGKYRNLENTLNRAIILAEESSNTIKKVAFDESKLLIEDAKKNASRIVNNALLRAEKVEHEAEVLRRKVVIFKKRFRNMVEDSLEEIEKFEEHL